MNEDIDLIVDNQAVLDTPIIKKRGLKSSTNHEQPSFLLNKERKSKLELNEMGESFNFKNVISEFTPESK
jgi:hypothetical protein